MTTAATSVGANILASFRTLPTWVRLWVAILATTNMACVAFLHTPTGVATAAAGIFILATNGPMLYRFQGFSRLMSVPHLPAWGASTVYVAMRLTGQAGASDVSSAELAYGWAVVVVNGISLLFDAADTVRWVRGEREIVRPGA